MIDNSFSPVDCIKNQNTLLMSRIILDTNLVREWIIDILIGKHHRVHHGTLANTIYSEYEH